MRRVRKNATVRVTRKTSAGFSGEETYEIVDPRVRARLELRNDSTITAEGIIRGTEGTFHMEASANVKQGDKIEVLTGPRRSKGARFYVESLDEEISVTGKVRSVTLTVSRDSGRRDVS